MTVKWSNKRAFDKYLNARQDFIAGRYKLAINKLISLDLIDKNDDVNHLLVKCLYYQKSYGDAEQVLLADVNSYTVSASLMKLMINVLLKNHEFIMCRKIVASLNDRNLKIKFNHQISNREHAVINEKPNEVHENAKRFYHLSNGSLIQQRINLRKAQKLPLRPFLNVARHLLTDPFLAPIMRLSILEVIRKMSLNIKLRYRWINHHIYDVNVGKLIDLTKTKSYQQIMKIVNTKYYHNPPQTLALKQNLRLYLTYLYPYTDQKIVHPQLWVKIAALRLQGKQPIFDNQKIKKIYYLQVKLDGLTKNLIK